MNNALFPDFKRKPGFRLSKIELYNWGTFDGSIHSFSPRGDWALLVGENGTGKSTIVDAMLTLLVRPQTRKYNFASGAAKTERDERTYIQGAYDKIIGDAGTPQLKYLRPGHKHYSALLACFDNEETQKTFTVCQILYLDANNSVKKYYAIDESRERGINEDLGSIKQSSSVLTTLKNRDFRATESYKQYFEWLKRKVSCKPKAMDMFNQAAWVKDVHQLDTFVRNQMLEKKPWDEKVSQLLTHFAELSEAHRALEIARDQALMLAPIMELGVSFRNASEKLNQAKQQLSATNLYFSFATKQLLEPMCEEWTSKLNVLDQEIKQNEDEVDSAHREVARINLEIEGAGGERMQRLPGMIQQEQREAETKQKTRHRFESLLRRVEIETQIDSSKALTDLHKTVRSRQTEIETEKNAWQEQSQDVHYQLGHLKQKFADDHAELTSLESRKGNMPRDLVDVREQICRELKIAAKDLPFAAELMAVDTNFREWEASIEQVLGGFGKDLLVKDQHYAQVSGFIDAQRLTDQHGRGLKISYRRIVGNDSTYAKGIAQHSVGASLLSMLKFRTSSDLAPWVRGQIADRFDYLACESIADFQQAHGKAMTRNRHTKRNQSQHSKDDRGQVGDRKGFILGWENREKILALKESVTTAEADLSQLEERVHRQQRQIETATNRLSDLRQVVELESFDEIDHMRHLKQVSEYQNEYQQLLDSNDLIRELKHKKFDIEREIEAKKITARQLSDERSNVGNGLKNGQLQLQKCDKAVNQAEQDGSFQTLQPQFSGIETLLKKTPLSIDNMLALPQEFQESRYNEVKRLEERISPILNNLTTKMGRFLAKFPALASNMDANVESLPQFISLQTQIEKDDLPRHEKRFKDRLNENVLHDVGVLYNHLETEREEIKQKIEEINNGLQRMEWQPGTHVRLDPVDTKDAEIRAFRRELSGCLTGIMGDTNHANVETFNRIKTLVDKLQDDNNTRWREKVIDVRNWFSFSAQELNTLTGEPGSYYDGGSGKSGGEKARLAFLVLVAAIVYQYDIDPDDEQSDKFHFVMVDEMFSRTATKYAEYALNLFDQFGLQLLMVAPLDAKARVCEPYVGLHAHVVKNEETCQSEILSLTSEQYHELSASNKTRKQTAK